VIDIRPHLDNVARTANLTGMVRGLGHALEILIDNGQHGTPSYREIFELCMTADESIATTPVLEYRARHKATAP
jgi:hypothetical protein